MVQSDLIEAKFLVQMLIDCAGVKELMFLSALRSPMCSLLIELGTPLPQVCGGIGLMTIFERFATISCTLCKNLDYYKIMFVVFVASIGANCSYSVR